MPLSPVLNPIPVPSPFLRLHFPFPSTVHGFHLIPRRASAAVANCTSSGNTESGGLKEALSGLVDAQVEELLSRKENQELLDGLDRASARVEKAKRELAAIQEQELEARRLRQYVEQLEGKASKIAESQREILEARAMIEEAERSLSTNGEAIGKNEERLESGKAAAVSAIVGTLASLPVSLSHVTDTSQLILPLAITFVSCALFGLTFRYTIRRDLDNIQLKIGNSAAFAFVQGLAVLVAGPPLELSLESFVSHAFDGALLVSESLLVFGFAGIALDFCFQSGLISTFPIQKSPDSS